MKEGNVSAIEPRELREGRLHGPAVDGAERRGAARRGAEMKITVRRDTWTASAAAVVGARSSGSVGPRSDRSRAAWRRPSAPAAAGGGGRGGSVAARVVLRDPGLPGSGGWQPGWKHANDPLIPSRDIGPLTHASAGDPSGAASNMPSQLFDSTHNLCPLCPSLALPHSLLLPSSLRLLDFPPPPPPSIGHTLLRIYLAPFSPIYPARPRSIFRFGEPRALLCLVFVCSHTHTPIPVSSSVVFPSLSPSAVHFISFAIVISVSPKFRAG